MNAGLAPVPERLPTRITELLNIRWPLLLGGMMWLSDARLVAAMVRAGGMGFITARSYPTDQAFLQALRECRRLTEGQPFGVNLTLSRRAANNEVMHGRLQVALAEGVRIFETAGLPPTDLLPAILAADQIEHNGASILQTIERMLKRLHPEHHMRTSVAVQQTFTLASFAERLPIEVQPTLGKPLKSNVVVHEAAFVDGYGFGTSERLLLWHGGSYQRVMIKSSES